MDADLGAEAAQFGNAILGSGGHRAASAEQRDRAGPLLRHPARHGKAKPGDTAGNQIRSVAPQRQLGRRRQLQPSIPGGQQHDLPDMPRGLHQPEGVLDRGKRKGAMSERPDRARSQGLGHLAEQSARQIGPLDRQLIDVDREIRNVLPQGPQVNAAVQIEVAFAELEKAAERLQDAEALLHSLAAQRIEDDVDALAICDRAHRIGKAEIARVEHMVGAGEAQECALGLGARGRNDDRAAVLGVLDRGEADTARRGMDQNMLARRQLGERAERVDHGDEHDRNRCRRREARLRRDPHDRMLGRNHFRAQGCRSEPRHAVADGHAFDAGTDRTHDAGTFQPKGRPGKAVDQRLLRQETHRPHHVAEIEAGGLHLDCHLTFPKLAVRDRLPAQRVEPAGPLAAQPQPIAGFSPARRQRAAQA
jgi:hypothetical protein